MSDSHPHEQESLPELTEGDMKWLRQIEERRLRGLALRDRVQAVKHDRHVRHGR